MPWGAQEVAGHATATEIGWYDPDSDGGVGQPMFVGEHGDLLWKAVTETTSSGLTPLKIGLWRHGSDASEQIAVAAALYDETAREQLTTELFVGVDNGEHRTAMRTNILKRSLSR